MQAGRRARERRRLEGIDPGVDLADGSLPSRRVPGLDDSLHVSAPVANNPAEDAWLGRTKSQQREIGSFPELFEQPGESLGSDQRHVSGKDHHRSVSVRQSSQRPNDCVPGSSRGILDDDGYASSRQERFHRRAGCPEDDHDPRWAKALR